MKSHAAAQTREQRQASHPDTRPLAVSQAHAAVAGPVSAGTVFADQRPVQTPLMQAPGRWQAIADQSDSALQLQAWQTRMDNSPAALQMQARAGILQAHARKNNCNISNSSDNRHKLHHSAQPDAVAKASRTGLPHQLKSGMESLSGISLDAVRVHYNSGQPAQLHAHAYAQGTDIHLGPGQEQHLPHEAWHVVQQAQGRVRPTMQMKAGVAINDDAGLENEADVMGARAMAAGGQVTSRAQVENTPLSNTNPGQFSMQAAMPAQLMREDAANYVFRNKDEFYKIKAIADSLFKDCKKGNNTWWNKWKINGKVEYLEGHVFQGVDKDWVKKWVADKSLAPELRLGLLAAWNLYQEDEKDIKEETEELGEKGDKVEGNMLSKDLVADLIMDVSTLSVGKNKKLKRKHSFTFNDVKKVAKPDEFINTMESKVLIKTGDKESEPVPYPCTAYLKLAALYIRAYGDKANSDGREASTKFVFDLGGSLGVYRDTSGNGDLFYFPLKKTDEKNVYQQEGGSTDHTWDKLANHLSENSELKNVHTRLAQVLHNEFNGTLSKSEVIAIGAMLADAKYSIQGWLYAVEQLEKYEFDGKTISKLFDITGNPFWKYSLNASNQLNKDKRKDRMGRKAGIGYKELDLKEQKGKEKKEEKKEKKKEEKKTSEILFDDSGSEKDEEENSSEDEDKYEKKKSPSLKPSFKTKKLEKKKNEKRKQSELKRKVDKTEFEKETKPAEKFKRKKNVGKSFSDNEDELEEKKISKNTDPHMEEEDAGSSNEEDDNDSIIRIEEEEGF